MSEQQPLGVEPPQPQDVVQNQQFQGSLQPPQSTSLGPHTNSAGENLQCQWVGCGERCISPEALYEHVCERHVGRKSTNNLNLTCQWGTCRTTTVKRDHITSHIRVHVPLKPHKCDFCGKAFKRPQDLKKHVKTHAEDNDQMRGSESTGGPRQPQPQNAMMYNDKNYYTQAMPQPDYVQHQPNPYYQPQASHQGGQHVAYGPVYYQQAPAQQTSYHDFESRKRGFDALDQFFGEVKRRQFDPVNYQNVSRRLFELQGLQLPLITQQPISAIPAYQPVTAIGGGYESADPIQAYSLPPMGNAKTRGDLTSIDQILEQMQATIYENDTNLAQAGISQPGASYVPYRTSNSPTSATQLPSTHAQSSMPISHQHHSSIASAGDNATTPGLTPPSSAQSYTSGQSPMTGHAAPTSGAMYPNLPAADMAYAAANAATLGNAYDNDDMRRRYSGGMLQRAQPATRGKVGDVMDVESEGSLTPPAAQLNKKAKGKKPSPKNSVIDPALSGETSSSKTGDVSKDEADRQSHWVENMRLIEWIREMIKKKLETTEFDDEGNEIQRSATSVKVEGDVHMSGTDGANDEADEEAKKDEERLYPVLEAVKADDA